MAVFFWLFLVLGSGYASCSKYLFCFLHSIVSLGVVCLRCVFVVLGAFGFAWSSVILPVSFSASISFILTVEFFFSFFLLLFCFCLFFCLAFVSVLFILFIVFGLLEHFLYVYTFMVSSFASRFLLIIRCIVKRLSKQPER